MARKIKKAFAAVSAAAVTFSSLICFQGSIWANAEEFDSNGFASDGAYQEAVLTTDKYDIDNNGSKDAVYEISNAGQLYWFANKMGNYGEQNAVLTADITVNTGNIADCNGENYNNWREWILISKYGYSGIFDGQGHTISGLYYNGSDENAGLFGSLNGGKILNVGVENSYFNCGGTYTGGICGYNSQGTISGCYIKGTVKCSVDVGGVVGYNNGTVINCYNNGFVDGQSSQCVGGICAYNNDNISNCYNTGKITFSGASGGICGNDYGTIEKCYYLDTCKGDDNIYGEFSCKVGTETTSEKFASGEIAYILQNEQSENIWGQKIGEENLPVLGGLKVYQNKAYSGCEGNKGDAVLSYSNTQKSDTYADHNYSKGGICVFCNKIENGKDGFKSVSLALTDGVIMNYYLLLSDDMKNDSGAYIQFTSENGINKKVMISEGVGVEDENSGEISGKYKYSIELRPDQMADEITAQVFYGNGEKGSSVNYSVKQYVKSIKDGESYKELADAMLRYGAYAQLYTGKNTGNMAAEVQDYSVNRNIGDEYKYSLSEKISGIEVKSAALLVGSDTTIKIKYQIDSDYDINDFEFKCNYETVKPEKTGDFYCLYIKNIKPQNLDKMYKFYVYNHKTSQSYNLSYSAFSYMKNVLEKSELYDKNLVNLVNSMYEYNKKAKEYSPY